MPPLSPQKNGLLWFSRIQTCNQQKTLWKFSIASITIEHGPFVDDLPRTYHVIFECPSLFSMTSVPPHLWNAFEHVQRCSEGALFAFVDIHRFVDGNAQIGLMRHPVSHFLENILLTKNGGHIGHALIRKMANNCLIPSFARTKKGPKKSDGRRPIPKFTVSSR